MFFSRQLSSDTTARQELDLRRIEREAARESKVGEEKEERRKENEREERRHQQDHTYQLLQLQMMKVLTSHPQGGGHMTSHSQGGGSMTYNLQEEAPAKPASDFSRDHKLEVNLKMKEEEEDSETYLVKVFIGSFEEFVCALKDFCGIDAKIPVKIILFHLNRILDIHLLETGKTYLVEYKKKEEFVRIHLDY